MSGKLSLYFDAKDHELLKVVNRFLERDRTESGKDDSIVFPHGGLHPHGIKELAESQEIRVAYAVINLLDSLEVGQAQDRINALTTLHDEVLYSASTTFRHNTGRVLIQIMKSLIRAHGNPEEQLRLAHDFRKASSGKRRIIRQMLRRYYLLEMPEEWNQLAFDHHVHDANTKGRKSPTHMIMDAWIKGIRDLDVVYYNFVEPVAVTELLQAARIMGIEVRVGVEFLLNFRNKPVQVSWQPQGFTDYRDMLNFLEERPTRHLMRMGREASQYHHSYIMRLLGKYNRVLRFEMGALFEVSLPEIPEQEILSFVGIGQTSKTHLAEVIYRHLYTAFSERMHTLRENYEHGDEEERVRSRELVKRMNDFDAETIVEEWLSKEMNPDVVLPFQVDDESSIPEIMRLLPVTLMDWLTSVRSPCDITLNLNTLNVEDVLELLYQCQGMITHLELFNLKYYGAGKMCDMEEISQLQTAINDGSAIALKRLIRNIIKERCCDPTPEGEERRAVFTEILRNIPKLQSYYAAFPLRARIGSDSTGRSSRLQGMGFVFIQTLPKRAQAELARPDSEKERIPLRQDVYARVTYYPRRFYSLGLTLTKLIQKIPGLDRFDMRKERTWLRNENCVRYRRGGGNIATLGGTQRDRPLFELLPREQRSRQKLGMDYMNTTAKNVLKVAVGFALTVITFVYTQTWWFLIWFGPVIWFAITGFRNVLQATLGGGGLRRTPLLTWNAYLSWSRLCDSLLFTGVSVPLLEWGVRMVYLEQYCGINAVQHPVIFYTVLSLVNGVYIAAHNIYRGLPREAVIGNIFRSILSIPVSIFYGFAGYELFVFFGWPTMIIVQAGAVISKLASDSVAAVIEGIADKHEYLRMRYRDYHATLTSLFACYARLEVILPEEDLMELLQRPKDFIRVGGDEGRELEKAIIVNALDLMYFWMYQPRGRSTLARILPTMTSEELAILTHTQLVLTRVHEISQMFVDGLTGSSFARPLAFYLDRHEEYLRDMERLTGATLLPEHGN